MAEMRKCLQPFCPVEGQGLNEFCVIFEEVLNNYIADCCSALLVYRAVFCAIMDSDGDQQCKHELLSAMFTRDFAMHFEPYLKWRLSPRTECAIYPEDDDPFYRRSYSSFFRYNIGKLIQAAFRLVLTDESVRCMTLAGLGCTAMLCDDSEKMGLVVSSVLRGEIRSFLSHASTFSGGWDISKVLPGEEERIDRIADAALNPAASDGIVAYICREWMLTEAQIQIKMYGARRSWDSSNTYELLENKYGEVAIVNYFGKEEDLTVPDRIDGHVVAGIFGAAFSPVSHENPAWFSTHMCKWRDAQLSGRTRSCHMKHIVVPDSVREIGEYTFSHMTKLESVVIPDSVGWLPSFDGCTALKQVVLPKRSPGWRSSPSGFHSCERLEFVEIPEGIWACPSFGKCAALKYVSLPDYLDTVSSYTFSGCSSLETIWLTAKKFTNNVFDGCSALRDVYLPNLTSARSDGLNLKHCPNLVIHGYPRSYAEKFAKRIGAPFVADCSPRIREELLERYKKS